MPSVATPTYPIEIVNPAALLPQEQKRTITQVMDAIEQWPYWSEIKAVAWKEYRIKPKKFDALLPEYQRFLGLIMVGYGPVGMFSVPIDKMWHSQVLCSHLWADLCLGIHGRMINHVAQIPEDGAHQKGAICTTCVSCRGCNTKCKNCQGSDVLSKGRVETAQAFAAVYQAEFGHKPPKIWNLKCAEACAAD